jgi:hypothetical protein
MPNARRRGRGWLGAALVVVCGAACQKSSQLACRHRHVCNKLKDKAIAAFVTAASAWRGPARDQTARSITVLLPARRADLDADRPRVAHTAGMRGLRRIVGAALLVLPVMAGAPAAQTIELGPGTRVNAGDLVALRAAAEGGSAGAQYNLGLIYANGMGVDPDQDEAVRWFHLAGAQGHAGAQYNLGMIYARGLGVFQDELEAVRWYREAAEQDHAQAQNNLGLMYTLGRGVAVDHVEARTWYARAAAQGHAGAQYNFGLTYANGDGVEQDFEMAAQWYRRAAEQGVASAQHNLALLYVLGDGVPQDNARAYLWLNVAAAQSGGQLGGGADRVRLEAELPRTQQEELLALAIACRQARFQNCEAALD